MHRVLDGEVSMRDGASFARTGAPASRVLRGARAGAPKSKTKFFFPERSRVVRRCRVLWARNPEIDAALGVIVARPQPPSAGPATCRALPSPPVEELRTNQRGVQRTRGR